MNDLVRQISSAGFEQLASESDGLLSSCDIAVLNLSAAKGLPGTETLDIPRCLDQLDAWAERVRFQTLRHLYRFDPRSNEPPSEFSYGNSLGRFLCYILLQVLQEDCGVRYNPARKFSPDFCEPADLFIHGILDDAGAGGTCASMPVVYVAVGRRLGYPLRLVEGREHLFVRWHDARGTTVHWTRPDTTFWIPPDRFNVEGSGEGIAYHSDAHYIQWPQLWTEADFAHGRYLRSLTAKEELACFLVQRGECFWDLGQPDESLKACHFARQLAPDDSRYEWLHAKRTLEYDHQQSQQLEMVMWINQRNRQARARVLPAQGTWPGRTVKIALGRPISAHLPPGTPIQCVPLDEGDPLPEPHTAKLFPAKPPTPDEVYRQQVERIQEQNRTLLAGHDGDRAIIPMF